MCGIAGIVSYGDSAPPADPQALARMTARMAARGPDGNGAWISPDGRTALGHRRLAIIELSPAGAQPMLDPATGNAIVFNGEIYNFRELKHELEASGTVFRSDSDTEVLLQLYARFGERMLEQLRGMFALAIWDANRRALFLARDPLGIKPLYYADDGRTLRFASQVKALLAAGEFADTPSAAGMAGFFLWGHVPEPWTWVEEVKALPAGCTLTINRDASGPKLRHYFDLRAEIVAAERSAPPTRSALGEALSAVEDSIRQHLVADVPVGAFLSAGRDSTLVATLAARQLREPLHTITLGFDEYRGTTDDEVPVAERVAQLLGARHDTRHVRRESFEASRESILDAMDQPSIDGVNTWLVSRAAAQAGLKVALSGLGGDELFGGYPSFTQVPQLARRLRIFALAPALGRAFRFAAAPFVRQVVNPKWASLAEYGGTLHSAWLLRRALFMPWELPRLMPEALAREGLAALEVEAELRSRIDGIRSPALAVMALEMSGYMRLQLLRDADWAGMAHSLEIRVPLVDVTLLRRWLPVAAHRFPLERQRLLEAADARVAAAVGTRPKSGFSVPVTQWLSAGNAPASGMRGPRTWARSVSQRFLLPGPHPAPTSVAAGANEDRSPSTNSAHDPARPMAKHRILIFRYGQLGDVLVALPAIRAVREEFPDAQISLLCDKHRNSNWVIAKQVLPPSLVDQVVTYDADSSGIPLRSAVALFLQLRASRFDTLIYLAPRARTRAAVLRDVIFFRACGIKDIAGHKGIVPLVPGARRDRPLPIVEHEADNLLERLRISGIDAASSRQGINLLLATAEREEADLWLENHSKRTAGKPLIAFSPGSKWPSKRWPEERYLELGKRLLKEFAFTPVIVGGLEDRARGEALIEGWQLGLNAAGELSVRGSAALLERCRMHIGNDNGVTHLAAAVGVPCVGIFAAQDWPGRWHPYGAGHKVLRKHPPCEGCKLVDCVENSMRCLKEITVDEVLAACRAMIRSAPMPAPPVMTGRGVQ